MELFQIISLVLWIIILIVFFRMGSNVSAIKDELKDLRNESKKAIRREHNLNYQLNRVIGNNQEALKNLTFIMMYDLTAEPHSAYSLREKYEELKAKNADKFIKLGGTFFDYPF